MSEQTDLEAAFHNAMLSLLEKAKRVAKVASTQLLQAVKEKGALPVAREQFQSIEPYDLPFDFPEPYFKALAIRKRLDLTIETLILSPHWQSLFSKDEKETALKRLQEYGYTPSAAELEEVSHQEIEQGTAAIPEQQQPEATAEHLVLEFELLELAPCEQLALVDQKLNTGLKFFPRAEHRHHLRTCAACRHRFPRLLQKYDEFDERQINILQELLRQLRVALSLDENLVKRLALENWLDLPEDYQREEEASGIEWDDLCAQARELLANRAVLLAAYTGAIMRCYSQTHTVNGDPWVEWRKETGNEQAAVFVRNLDQQNEYLAALIATNVHRVFQISRESRVLTVPSIGDVKPISNVLDVEHISLTGEWEELLNFEWEGLLGNTTTQKLNYRALLLLAFTRAQETLRKLHPQRVHSSTGPDLRKELLEIKEELESVKATQIPMIELFERIAAQTDKANRGKTEERLRAIMGLTYAGLHPKTRASILGAERIYQTEGFPEPSVVVSQGALKSQQLELQNFCRIHGLNLDTLLETMERYVV